jgi:hypothetical protein
MRARRAGFLDLLIDKATKNGSPAELAVLLNVSRFSVYKWNLGVDPSYWRMLQINKLCRKVGTRPLYRLSDYEYPSSSKKGKKR